MFWVIFGGIILIILYMSLFSLLKLASKADAAFELEFQDIDKENAAREENSFRNLSVSTVLEGAKDFYPKTNALI